MRSDLLNEHQKPSDNLRMALSNMEESYTTYMKEKERTIKIEEPKKPPASGTQNPAEAE